MNRASRRAAFGALSACLVLTGCVRNVESSTPDGWEPPQLAAVPEIAAMYHDPDGVLTVGSNTPFPPLEFRDSDGTVVGMEIDLIRAIAQVMGLEVQPMEQDFAMILPAVQAGQVDVGVSGFTDNEERRKNFDFVDHLYAGIQWAERTDGIRAVDPANPCGLTVAVQRTTVSETDDVWPKREACGGDLNVLSYDSSDNSALAVIMGRADAFSADSPVTAWAVNRSKGKLRLVGDMFDAAPYGFAVRKDSDLGRAIAAALEHLIQTGEYAAILHRWGVTEGLLDHALINEERPDNV